jgi:hypothetical protein
MSSFSPFLGLRHSLRRGETKSNVTQPPSSPPAIANNASSGSSALSSQTNSSLSSTSSTSSSSGIEIPSRSDYINQAKQLLSRHEVISSSVESGIGIGGGGSCAASLIPGASAGGGGVISGGGGGGGGGSDTNSPLSRSPASASSTKSTKSRFDFSFIRTNAAAASNSVSVRARSFIRRTAATAVTAVNGSPISTSPKLSDDSYFLYMHNKSGRSVAESEGSRTGASARASRLAARLNTINSGNYVFVRSTMKTSSFHNYRRYSRYIRLLFT